MRELINRKVIFLTAVIVGIVLLYIFWNQLPEKAQTPEKPTPTPTLVIEKNEITGWFAAWDGEKEEVLSPLMKYFHTFSPMLYRVQADSSLGRHSLVQRSLILKHSFENNIPLAPVITDESDYVRINRLLRNEKIQEEFISELVEEAELEGFIGWSIDIEKLKSTDKEEFSEFVKNAANKLHENDLKLFIIAYGRVENETYDPAEAHDYKVFGEYADQVQLMIYNFNNDFTGPGGQTPLKWYRDVLSYASKSIPREKILVGLSTHGYEWGGTKVQGLTYQEVVTRVEQTKAKVSYDPKNSAEVATYASSSGKKHTIYFEDAKSIVEKMNIARDEFGINKFAFWRISAEDPKLWEVIAEE